MVSIKKTPLLRLRVRAFFVEYVALVFCLLSIGYNRWVFTINDPDNKAQSQQEGQPVLMTLLNNLPGMAYRCRHTDGQRVMLLVSRGSLDLTGFQPEELVLRQNI